MWSRGCDYERGMKSSVGLAAVVVLTFASERRALWSVLSRLRTALDGIALVVLLARLSSEREEDYRKCLDFFSCRTHDYCCCCTTDCRTFSFQGSSQYSK